MCAHSTCCCGQEPEPEAEAEPEPEPEGDGEKKDETLTKIEKDRKKAQGAREFGKDAIASWDACGVLNLSSSASS